MTTYTVSVFIRYDISACDLLITYHSRCVNYISSKMHLSKSYSFVMGVFNDRVITLILCIQSLNPG